MEDYYKKIYPIGTYKKLFWKNLIFFYSCVPDLIKQYFGDVYVPSENDYIPPPLNRAWVLLTSNQNLYISQCF